MILQRATKNLVLVVFEHQVRKDMAAAQGCVVM